MVVAVSKPVAQQVRNATRGRVPVLVAPNAPAKVFRNPISNELSREVLNKYLLTKGSYILSVASRDPRKNLEALVDGYLALPQGLRTKFPLVLVGGSSSVFAGVSFRKDNSIRSLGYVTDEELAALYEGSNLVAFPSLDEGFGLPTVEALSTGARLLVSDVEVMRWVCQEHAHYVNPKSRASISKGLLQLLNSDDTTELRSARMHYVHSRFTWAKSAKVVEGGLISMLGSSECFESAPESVA